MNIAIGIRRAREYRSRSQRDLSLSIDVDASYISRAEAGAHQPSLDVLGRIAHELDVPIIQIVEWSSDALELRAYRAYTRLQEKA